MATLLSVNVGLPADVEWQGRTVHTGVWKGSVEGPRMVRRLNVDGDGQGDVAGHGGEQRAVLVYQVESYRYWEDHFGRDDFRFGEFGENFTVSGLSDAEVCIGDRYRIGEAEFEVTQPRVTCFRVGLRFGEPRLPALLVAHHRPGFYLRVITEGRVEAGDAIVRTRAGHHALTVADVDALLYLPGREVERLRAAVDVPALSPGWQQSFRELLDGVQGAVPAEVPPAGRPAWSGFRCLRVLAMRAETATVTSLYLGPENGDPLPPAVAGQYVAVRVTGAGDPPPVRSYSLSSDPGADAYRISVKREPHGAVSAYVHASLRPGATVDVAAPRGEFVLVDDDKPVLLISAGIGVTPVLAMVHALADARSTREVWWIHVAHDARHHPFADEAHHVLQSLPRSHELTFYSSGGESATASTTTSGVVVAGRPSLEALSTLGLPRDASAYVCGPARFMRDLQDDLARLGIAPARVHTELFGSRPAFTPGIVGDPPATPHQPPGPAGVGSLVTFARSGLSVSWSPEWRSLLELAEACDVPTRWSCRSGVCHTCITPVLSGEVTYDPEPLEFPATGEALICCARPAGAVAVDL